MWVKLINKWKEIVAPSVNNCTLPLHGKNGLSSWKILLFLEENRGILLLFYLLKDVALQ